MPSRVVAKLRMEKKGRGGKTVTVIAGVPGSPSELEKLLSELKRLCGTGGTLRGDLVEIQGDHRTRLRDELSKRGFTVKLAGG